MPCLSNLINSPASALPELKPVVYEAKCNPDVARGAEPGFLELGPQSEVSDGDAKNAEFRRDGEGEGPDGKGPKESLVPFSGKNLRLNGACGEDGEGIERDLKLCQVQEGGERRIQEGFSKFKWLFLVGAPKLVIFLHIFS